MPVSPVMRTVESLPATLDTRDSTAVSAGEAPDNLFEHRGSIHFVPEYEIFSVELVFQRPDLSSARFCSFSLMARSIAMLAT